MDFIKGSRGEEKLMNPRWTRSEISTFDLRDSQTTDLSVVSSGLNSLTIDELINGC